MAVYKRRRTTLLVFGIADRAETVAQLETEQAQLRAREEIVREMHDVLGHRLSLLSVHAGALAYRPDASTEEVAGARRSSEPARTRRCRTCAK